MHLHAASEISPAMTIFFHCKNDLSLGNNVIVLQK